jgi:hypothetical protein
MIVEAGKLEDRPGAGDPGEELMLQFKSKGKLEAKCLSLPQSWFFFF